MTRRMNWDRQHRVDRGHRHGVDLYKQKSRPTRKMTAMALILADRHGVELPPEYLMSFEACKWFIGKYIYMKAPPKEPSPPPQPIPDDHPSLYQDDNELPPWEGPDMFAAVEEALRERL